MLMPRIEVNQDDDAHSFWSMIPPLFSRRRTLTFAAAPFVVPVVARAASRTLYVNSYGGVLEDAYKQAFFAPFQAASGIDCKPVSPVSYAKLRAEVQSRSYEWDLTNMGDVDLAQAEYDGLTDPLDTSIIKPADFPPGMIRGNGIGGYALGTNLVYRRDSFPNGGPQSWADFWDVRKFPGDRCLFNRPFTCLAFALLADGVPRDKLYPMDVDRAFLKMDEIKPHIKVWWTEGSQSQQLIRDGEVDMISMWSARAVDLINQGVNLELVWNQAENYTSRWFVPKGNPTAATAWSFVNFVCQPQRQADFTKLLPYGPANVNAVPLIPQAQARLTPSWPANLAVSFQHDADWLAPRLGAIRERWTEWLAS